MSDEQSTIEPAAGANGPEHAVGTGDTAVQTTGEMAYDPAAEDDRGGTSRSRSCPADRAGGCSAWAGTPLHWRCSACC